MIIYNLQPDTPLWIQIQWYKQVTEWSERLAAVQETGGLSHISDTRWTLHTTYAAVYGYQVATLGRQNGEESNYSPSFIILMTQDKCPL